MFATTKEKQMQKTEIDIDGMTCGHCAMSITKELSATPGVQEVKVDHATGKAFVEGAASEEAMAAAIDRAGYKATKFEKVND